MRIYLDYDSVLNNLGPAWTRWIQKTFGHKVTLQDMIHFNWLDETFPGANDFWKTPGIYHSDVLPLPRAVDFVRACERLVNPEDVFIITSSPENMEREKDAHIALHFGILADRIIHAHDKAPFTKDGILVDDHPKNCIAHINAHSTPAILFNLNGEYGWAEPSRYSFYEPEYHDRYLLRATSYESVIQHIRNRMLMPCYSPR